MASTQQLKHRIGSVKNTKQITKAMELVSASKMRRAQESAVKSRDYRTLAVELLSRLRQLADVSKHPLYKQRDINSRLHVVITSDRGLAGAYNSNVLKLLAAELKTDRGNKVTSKLIVIGRQAAHFTARLKDVEIVAVYEHFPEHPTANDIRPILNTVVDMFVGAPANTPAMDAEVAAEKPKKRSLKDYYDDDEDSSAEDEPSVDAVDIIYTDYKSSISQQVAIDRLLPVAFSDVEIATDLGQATFEPSVKEVLDNVTLRLVEAQLNQDFLESMASEHSMRMMAMKSATDNAMDLIDDLTLAFNTARQAGITQEIAEITGGVEAIK